MSKENSKKKEDKKEEETEVNLDVSIEELGEAGLHFGHTTSKRHPNMKPYIDGVKRDVHIFDLTKTAEKLERALEFLVKAKNEGKTILMVGTKPQFNELVEETAEKNNLPYITYRWIGGFVTNFEEIKKRIDYLNEQLEKREAGEFEKYTKKEQLEIDREIDKLQKKFGGVRDLEELPDVIFALDMDKDEIAVDEANQKDVDLVAVCDTNTDPTLADYPIPANDDAVSSIRFILEKFDEALN